MLAVLYGINRDRNIFQLFLFYFSYRPAFSLPRLHRLRPIQCRIWYVTRQQEFEYLESVFLNFRAIVELVGLSAPARVCDDNLFFEKFISKNNFSID